MGACDWIFEKIRWLASKRHGHNCFTLCTYVLYSWSICKVARIFTQPDTFRVKVVISLIAVGSLMVHPLYTRYSHSYWRRRRIPTYSPSSRIFGIMETIVTGRESYGECTRKMYRYLRAKDVVHGGAYYFSVPIYMPVDENLSRNILTTDSKHFQSRGIYCSIKDDSMSGHLFSLEGAKWRRLREKLSDFSYNLESFFEISLRSAKELPKVLDATSVTNGVFELRDLVDRYTIDVIGNCALDIRCNALRFPHQAQRYQEMIPKKSALQRFVRHITYLLPDFVFPKTCAVQKDISEFFLDVVKREINLRESFNLGKRDFLHILLQLKNRGDVFPGDEFIFPTINECRKNTDVTFTFDDLARQAYLFFFCGFETFSSTMTFCLYELAMNALVQYKLKKEIRRKMRQTENHLSLDDFSAENMPYLHAVIRETLRKYPPVPALHRTCTEDYTVPGTNCTIQKGTQVVVPVWGLQSDEQLYHDPARFEPERFLQVDLARGINMSFGLGERQCIGQEFAMMQMKLGIIYFLERYAFDFETRRRQLPFKMNPESFILAHEGEIWLRTFSG